MITQKSIESVVDFLLEDYSSIGVGDDITPESIDDDSLGNELKREASTNSKVTSFIENDTGFFKARLDFVDSVIVRELGLFGDDKMFFRRVIPNIVVPKNDFLDVIVNVVVKECE